MENLTDKSEFINQFNDFMLTNKNLIRFPTFSIKNEHKQGEIKKNINNNNVNNIFFPSQQDQLFWCFFIILFNKHEYDMISNYFTREKQIKYEWIEKFRTRKDIFKTIKISRNCIEDELANKKQISMNTIKALCHLFDINIF